MLKKNITRAKMIEYGVAAVFMVGSTICVVAASVGAVPVLIGIGAVVLVGGVLYTAKEAYNYWKIHHVTNMDSFLYEATKVFGKVDGKPLTYYFKGSEAEVLQDYLKSGDFDEAKDYFNQRMETVREDIKKLKARREKRSKSSHNNPHNATYGLAFKSQSDTPNATPPAQTNNEKTDADSQAPELEYQENNDEKEIEMRANERNLCRKNHAVEVAYSKEQVNDVENQMQHNASHLPEGSEPFIR